MAPCAMWAALRKVSDSCQCYLWHWVAPARSPARRKNERMRAASEPEREMLVESDYFRASLAAPGRQDSGRAGELAASGASVCAGTTGLDGDAKCKPFPSAHTRPE